MIIRVFYFLSIDLLSYWIGIGWILDVGLGDNKIVVFNLIIVKEF